MPEEKAVATKAPPATLASILSSLDVKRRFEEILGAKSAAFISSIMSLYNANATLREAVPGSILQSAVIAATLDLPVTPSLGFAFIIPYRQKEGPPLAQFQIGYKGFIQLAIRTGQYKNINATAVYADMIQSWNPLTGKLEATPSSTWKMIKKGDFRDIVGYMAYFELLNGFEKTLYMTSEEITAHGKRYSKSFDKPAGMWMTNPNAMSLKTVLKLLLSKYGLLSVQMEKAMEVDQGVIDTTGEVKYDDRPEIEPVASKPSGAEKKINQDQFVLLMARIDKSGIERDEVDLYIKTTLSKENFHDLTVEELTKVLKWLEQEPPELSKEASK